MERSSEKVEPKGIFEKWCEVPSTVLLAVSVTREASKRSGPGGRTPCGCCGGAWNVGSVEVGGERLEFEYASLAAIETDHPAMGPDKVQLMVCDACAEAWEELENVLACRRLVAGLAFSLALGPAKKGHAA